MKTNIIIILDPSPHLKLLKLA